MRPGDRREFALLEFLVALIAISTLGAVLLDRLLFYQEAAEKAAMEQMAFALRSALRYQVVEQLMKGKPQSIAGLAGANPMHWLAEPPAAYAGELFAPEPGQVPKGSWYFDLKDRHLVYVVLNGAHFIPGARGRKEVRYVVRSEPVRQTPQVGRNPADKQEVNGVALVLAEPYAWF